jgi:Siphovirus Gp157
MTSLNDILGQQRLLQLMLENFIQGIEESATTTDDQQTALDGYIEEWETNACELEAKINAYGWAIRKIENDEAYYREQAKFYADKAKAKKQKANFLRSRVETFVASQAKKKFSTMDFTLSIQKTSIPKVVINDEWRNFPAKFIKEQKPSEYLDKQLIKSALKKGEVLPFASLEYTESLRGI